MGITGLSQRKSYDDQFNECWSASCAQAKEKIEGTRPKVQQAPPVGLWVPIPLKAWGSDGVTVKDGVEAMSRTAG